MNLIPHIDKDAEWGERIDRQTADGGNHREAPVIADGEAFDRPFEAVDRVEEVAVARHCDVGHADADVAGLLISSFANSMTVGPVHHSWRCPIRLIPPFLAPMLVAGPPRSPELA